MNEYSRDYLADYEGDRCAAVMAMAADLMRGDVATFKVGYSLDNALLAAAEALVPGPMGRIIVARISLTARRVAGFGEGVEGI
jgi:hypothetical protein